MLWEDEHQHPNRNGNSKNGEPKKLKMAKSHGSWKLKKKTKAKEAETDDKPSHTSRQMRRQGETLRQTHLGYYVPIVNMASCGST